VTDTIKRYTECISNDGGFDYADMRECNYGSYASVSELREKLKKAVAESCRDGDWDAYRTVLEWLGED
jgi:hypothetical protein